MYICKICGQDHDKARRCMNREAGRAGLGHHHIDPAVARAMVMSRIAKRGQTAKKTAAYTVVDGKSVPINSVEVTG
ncbi:MAG: hypothetical protein WC373_14890 [Smithella sp.]|jgi:hypothetical protein